MARPIDYQEIIEQDFRSDIVAEPQYDLFYNNGDGERHEEGTLRVLSLFSGCGGMDLGLEGGFICHNHSVQNPQWVQQEINENWSLLRKTAFRTVFACDILEEARLTWLKYMSRFHVNPDVFHLQSVVDLVKLHNEGHDVFPHDIDIVTGENVHCGECEGVGKFWGR